jgi:protoheme IX farnesyltransferase
MDNIIFRKMKIYLELTKPRITLLCLIMTLGGFCLASSEASLNFSLLGFVLLGTFLSVGAANALNMIYEKDIDKKMIRTSSRPLPSYRITLRESLSVALVLALSSLLIFMVFTNLLTTILSFFAIFSYVFIYTPLKRVTPLALVIGAVPGAIPVLLGFTAVKNEINLQAIILFLILFFWQMPHFIAIALFNKTDYEKAGIRVLPLVRGDRTSVWHAFYWSIALVISTLLPFVEHMAGLIYFLMALMAGCWFLWEALKGFYVSNTLKWSKKFFLSSLIYLPLITLALILDKFIYFLGS